MRTRGCGDGLVWQGVEQCDDANNDDSDACYLVVKMLGAETVVQSGLRPVMMGTSSIMMRAFRPVRGRLGMGLSGWS